MEKSAFGTIEFEQEYGYDGRDLGAVYTKDSTTFKVWAPTAEKVVLRLYEKGSAEEQGDCMLSEVNMSAEDRGIYACTVQGDLDGKYYTYVVTVDGIARETSDVYGKASGVNSQRSMVIDLARTNPEGWDKDEHVTFPLEDTQIWEVHINDFSNDEASGIAPEHRGKYLAFTDKTSTLYGDGVHPTCVNYLKKLGITHVHLLPTFDYGSIDEGAPGENINWGYDPVNYNVPEGSYSTDPYDGAVRIREFKEMVMALHQAGISVVMDVVYNHTYSLDSVFEKTVPGYYYRQDEEGVYSNGSACGNDTASDRQMYRRYMIDSILYWATEYHIDGFRFDLMGLHDVETMNQIRGALNELGEYGKCMILYGEPWSAGPSAFRPGAVPAVKDAVNQLDDGILMFNDDIRDVVKGPFNQLEVPGYVNGRPNMEEELKQVIRGAFAADYGCQPDTPAKLINYVSAHDNSTLWDKLVDSVKRDKSYNVRDEKLLAMNKLAAAIVQLSKGVPFMQAGEEAARTKQGEDNSYNLGKTLNQLDWKRMYEYQDLMTYYTGLMEIRKNYPEIKELTRESADRIRFLPIAKENIVAYENGRLLVIYNAGEEEADIELSGAYRILIQNGRIDLGKSRTVSGQVTVQGISAAVLEKE